MIYPQYTHFRLGFALGGAAIANDGMPEWPATYVRLAASGFGDTGSTFLGTPTPYSGTAMLISCNASATDAVPGVDEYDWYLSQRTDVPASQYLETFPRTFLGNTYSGSIRIVHTSLAESAFGFTPTTVNPSHIPLLFRNCHLYVQRRSDNAIQWLDLLRAQTAAYNP